MGEERNDQLFNFYLLFLKNSLSFQYPSLQTPTYHTGKALQFGVGVEG